MSTSASTLDSKIADELSSARIAVITEHWGDSPSESMIATRLVAGALSRHAQVDVLHLHPPQDAPDALNDSVFLVHKVPLKGARPLTAQILHASLKATAGARPLPVAAQRELDELEGNAELVAEELGALKPDAIVLAGHRQAFDYAALGDRSSARPRVSFLPLCEDLDEIDRPAFARLVERADAIVSSSPAEHHALLERFPQRHGDVHPLHLALTLNYGATRSGLFGVRFFGKFVLVIRSFPPGGPRYTHTVTHELLRDILEDVSVAEVDGDKWRIADRENTLELPVNPTRVNLWRLMAHALFTVDLRPQGPLARESIESMLLGTPVVVPESTAAASIAEAAGGGLWYRDLGEILDCSRLLMNASLRSTLAEQAQRYAQLHHGDMTGFVERIGAIVLGSGTTQ
jgi:hypothetical protein